MNTETTTLPTLTFFTKVKMTLAAAFFLCIGFITSVLVLTLFDHYAPLCGR